MYSTRAPVAYAFLWTRGALGETGTMARSMASLGYSQQKAAKFSYFLGDPTKQRKVRKQIVHYRVADIQTGKKPHFWCTPPCAWFVCSVLIGDGGRETYGNVLEVSLETIRSGRCDMQQGRDPRFPCHKALTIGCGNSAGTIGMQAERKNGNRNRDLASLPFAEMIQLCAGRAACSTQEPWYLPGCCHVRYSPEGLRMS
jgi:hypothetical protein